MRALGTVKHFLLDKCGRVWYKYRQTLAVIFGALITLPLLISQYHSKINPTRMLTITVSNHADHARRYFREAMSKEGNYYLDQLIEAHWSGKTSARLGLEGRVVDEETFVRLLNNRHPFKDERLTPKDGGRPMVDFTISAPKDVSLLHALTGSKEVIDANRYAVNQAMGEVEKLMFTQNNTKHARGFTHTGNIIWAGFEHHLSRPVEVEREGRKVLIAEPQLHHHCAVMNCTWNEAKGRYQALEIYAAHMNSDYIRSVYHASLGRALEQAGYQVERDGNFVRLSGVSRDIIERFSSRSLEINKIAQEKGLSAKQKGELGAKTRKNKGELSLSEAELLKDWKGRLTPEELHHLQNLKGKRFERAGRIDVKTAVDRSMEHFFERHSAISEKKVAAYALSLGYGYLTHEEVNAELVSLDNILRSQRDSIEYITTKEMVREEDHMIACAVAGKGKFPALNKAYQPKVSYLNDQQKTAIWDMLSSYDQTMILRGAAGVGKTQLLTEVKDGVLQAGKSFFAVAPSSQAVEVLREKGFEADTIAQLLNNPTLQQELKGSTLLVDEAGMVGVRDMASILDWAKRNRSRTILSGDSRQNSSPSYGDALRILETRAKLQVSTVNKVVRQKEAPHYRSAVEDLAKGRILEGYKKLDKQGAVKEIPDHDERLDKLSQDYVDTLAQKRSALIVSPTNLEGSKISQIVRQKLKKAKLITGAEKTFDVLKDLSWTEAQKKDALNYQKGQVVRYNRNSKGGFRAGSHHEVIAISKDQTIKVRDLKTGREASLPFQTPEHYAVHRKEQIALAKGDRIRLTNNAVSLQGTRMANGTGYQIQGFDKRGIQLSNGKSIPHDHYHYKYNYCDTSFSSQGKDASKLILSLSEMSYAATNDKSFYVAASRGTKDIALYCDDKTSLKKAIQRSGERLSAGEVARDHNKRQLERKQRDHYHSLTQNKSDHERFQERQKTASRGVSKDWVSDPVRDPISRR